MNDNIKKYKKFAAILTAICIVFSGCSKAKEETENDIDSIKLKSNQEIVACKITAIYGNEIDYTVVKEQSMSSSAQKNKMPSASGAPDMNGGDMSAGGPPDMGGEMPQGGEAPDMGGQNSQENGSSDSSGNVVKSENSESDKNSSQSDSSNSSDKESDADSSKSSDKSSKKVYTLTDETGSTTIPVGTDVITSLGKTTTFSRLSNGDIIKMLLEKDTSGEKVVVGVWIVS